MTELDRQLTLAVSHAYEKATAFRAIMDNAGLTPTDIQTVADLPRIPITSKDALIHMQQENPPFGGWLAVPVTQLQRIFFSPGPLYDPQGIYDETAAEAARQAFAALGLGLGDIALNTFLYHMVPAGLLLDEALRLLGVTVVPIGPGNSDLTLMVMMTLKANVFVGTPSFLDSIYSKALQMNMPPSALPLKKAFFTAEPYPAALREKFEGEYGLQTAQAYGTADLGLIGFERPGRTGLYIPDNLIVEIVDPENGRVLPDGELGEVIVTTFSRTYPLIRLGTGDLSIMEPDEAGERRLRGLYGRSGEAIKVRGMFLHPNQIKLVASAFPAIQLMTAVVTRLETQDVLAIHIQLAEGQEDVDRDKLSADVRAAVRQQAGLRVDTVEFVSEIDPGKRLVRDERH